MLPNTRSPTRACTSRSAATTAARSGPSGATCSAASLDRIIESGLNESVLLPGTSGFFKVWTSIPFAAVASHPMLSAGDQLPFAKPLASLGAEDINRDDRPDLIWQHRTTGDLAAWLMDGTRQLRAVSLGQVADTNWVLVGPK